MEIKRTQCDHCGKIHETPDNYSILGTDILSVPLKVKKGTQYFDFCNEDCLREFLIKREQSKALVVEVTG